MKPAPISSAELLARYAEGERDFRKVHLKEADFASCNLCGVDLSYAELPGASFVHANLRLARFERTNLDGANLSRANLLAADLYHARLCSANIHAADLQAANLTGAYLYEANLSEANLRDARLHGTHLYRTLLHGANLSCASIWQTDFKLTDLSKVSLAHTTLREVSFEGCQVTDLECHNTAFIDTNIGVLCNSDVRHGAQSMVDYRSVVRSVSSPVLCEFLIAAGMPSRFAEYMVNSAGRLSSEERLSMLRSVFISYGGPDLAFASKLRDALADAGVSTYLFAKNATPGERLYRLMHDAVNQHDRVIFVCSQGSLTRAGVINELRETLGREAREEGESRLIPVRLDNYVFDHWNPGETGLKAAVCDRVVADFTEWHLEDKFRDGVDRILEALRQKQDSLDR